MSGCGSITRRPSSCPSRLVRSPPGRWTSDVGAHPHYSGSQEGGGEKKYEERHNQDLDRFYDAVIGQFGKPDAVLLFGPGEAKLQLKERLSRSHVSSESIVAVESTGQADRFADCGEGEGTLRNRSLSRPASILHSEGKPREPSWPNHAHFAERLYWPSSRSRPWCGSSTEPSSGRKPRTNGSFTRKRC